MDIGDLLNPISRKDFFENVWGQAPLHITGHLDKFDYLPNISELPGILSGKIEDDSWQGTHNLVGQAYKQNIDGSIDKFMDVPIGMYTQMFNSGYGLCFNDVSFAIPELQKILAEFLGNSNTVNQDSVTCYLTPPASRGVLHFDNQHVFFVQRSGTKNWRVSNEPGIKSPFENLIYPSIDSNYFDYLKGKGYQIKLPAECGHTDLTLRQGDVLYLPPGHYHLGNTVDNLSFHYTITIEPVSFHSKIYALMHEKSRRFSSVINKDLRFSDKDEVANTLKSSCDIFRELFDEDLLKELIRSMSGGKNNG
jgi:ribosomal protein L16 Arg81 hydroxylase